jgi:hypothetical protein
MPPSGFLISCARLRISSRLACLLLYQPLFAGSSKVVLDRLQLEQQTDTIRDLRAQRA